MNWNFNFLPYPVNPTQTQPLFLFTIPYTPPPVQTTSQTQVRPISPPRQGIQISLTAAQLEEAGYENNKKAWNEEEDNILMSLFRKSNLSWKQISDKIPGRTPKMCYSRYRRIQSRSKEQWSRSQDAKIRNLIKIWGTDWQKISENFPRRTAKQVQDHYMNYLRPEINKEPWTLEEDLALIELLREFGKDWGEVEKRMNGRTQNQIKNRYFGRLKRLEDKKKEKEVEEVEEECQK